MAETDKEQPRHRIMDLKAGAHVMTLDAGVFCIFHAPGQAEAGPSGLPGVRITRAPGVRADALEVVTFMADGWMGAANSAALVRVHRGPAGVMVTTYQDTRTGVEAPRLQVIRLIGGVPDEMPAPAESKPEKKVAKAGAPSISGAAGKAEREIIAHIQRHGDVGSAVGEWVGTIGSKRWIEGFSIQPDGDITVKDVEYQAVLGRGWLSPWSEGGQFCGSRGMSLPVLGLRVRLKGNAAKKWTVALTASFTDGTEIGPLAGDGEALQADSLAPLEAFQLEFTPLPGEGQKTSSSSDVIMRKPAKRASQITARHRAE